MNHVGYIVFFIIYVILTIYSICGGKANVFMYFFRSQELPFIHPLFFKNYNRSSV